MSRASGPRIRTFKPERYHDERMAGVSRDARHLYDGLTTQADDQGRGTANLALIKATVLPFDDDATPDRIGGWLRELQAAGLLELYDVDGRTYFAVVSWADDQRVDRPTPSKLPAPTVAGETRPLAIPREESRALSPSRAPADRDLDRDLDLDLSSPNGAEADVREDVSRLCHLLADLMLANDAGARVAPDSERWRDAIRLLIDRDGRDCELVEQVIRWSQADDFWRGNILSPGKLREKFGQLALRMGTAGGARPTRPADGAKAERTARRLAALQRLGEAEHAA